MKEGRKEDGRGEEEEEPSLPRLALPVSPASGGFDGGLRSWKAGGSTAESGDAGQTAAVWPQEY